MALLAGFQIFQVRTDRFLGLHFLAGWLLQALADRHLDSPKIDTG